MRAITPVFSVLLIIILSVALVGFLWLFVTGTFNTLGLSGTSTVNESLVTISSCMKIESVYGNQVSIRNCGNGVITGDTLSAYIDDIPLGVTYVKYFGGMSIGTGVEAYPGNDLGGSSYEGGSVFTMPEDGIITMITAYVYQYDRSSTAKALIYSDNNGVPGNLLATSSNTVPLQTSLRWENFSITYSGKANTPYWLAIFGSTGHRIGYDNGATNQESSSWGNSWPNAPNPFNQNYGPSYHNFKDSIYATYTPVVKKDGVETVSLSGLWNFNVGGHTLRIANPRVVTEIPVNAVLPDSCVLSLDFDEGSGLVAYDSSAYGNNGTLKNYTGSCGSSACPQWADGKFGNALQFDGIGDYVEIPYSDNLNIADEMTVSAWIYPSTSQPTGGSNQIIQRINWGSSQGFFLREGYGPSQYHSPQFSVGNGTNNCGSNCWHSASAGSITPERWYHILGSVKANDKIKIYLNGVKKAEGNYLGIINQTSGVIDIGIEIPTKAFSGTIDSVRIYNQALTPDQTISLRPVSYD